MPESPNKTRLLPNRSKIAGERLWSELPSQKDGILDGSRGLGVEERLQQLDALTEIERIDIGKSTRVTSIEKQKEQLHEAELRVGLSLGDLGPAPDSVGVTIAYSLGIMLALITEASLVKDLANAFGVGARAHQWLIAVSIVLAPSLLLKLANSKEDPSGRLAGHRWFMPGMLLLGFLTVVAVACFRLNHLIAMEVENNADGTLDKVLRDHAGLIAAVFILLALTLTTLTMLLSERIDRSFRVHAFRLRLSGIRKKREQLERQLAVLQEQQRLQDARVAEVARACRADYMLGVKLGEAAQKAPVHFGPFRGSLAAVSSLGLGTVVGMLAQHLLRMLPIPTWQVAGGAITLGAGSAALAVFLATRRSR